MSPRFATSHTLFRAARTHASPARIPTTAPQSSSAAFPAQPIPTLPIPQMLSTFQSIPLRRPLDKTPPPDIPSRAVPPARTPSSFSLQSGTAPSASKYQTILLSLFVPPPSARNPKSIHPPASHSLRTFLLPRNSRTAHPSA